MMNKNLSIFDALVNSEANEIIEFLLNKIFHDELTSDSFWSAVTQSFNEMSCDNICSIGFAKNNLSFPNNVKGVVTEWIVKISNTYDIGPEILYSLSKLSDKNNSINGILISNPTLSAILIFSSILLKNIKHLGSGNLIISVNIKNNESQDIEIHNNKLYWPESLIRSRLHLSGFKRVRRLDRLEEYTTIKCEKNVFRNEGKRRVLNNYEDYIRDNKYITTALVCDGGFAL